MSAPGGKLAATVTAVAVLCSAWLAVAVIWCLAVQSARCELGSSGANLLERLLCYWTFVRLSVCLEFLRCRRKLLRALLLLLAAVLQFLCFCEDVLRDFFEVHGGVVVSKKPRAKS